MAKSICNYAGYPNNVKMAIKREQSPVNKRRKEEDAWLLSLTWTIPE